MTVIEVIVISITFAVAFTWYIYNLVKMYHIHKYLQ
jgi:hypothetical protein